MIETSKSDQNFSSWQGGAQSKGAEERGQGVKTSLKTEMRSEKIQVNN